MRLLGPPVVRLLAANAALGLGATIQTSNLSEDQIAERDRIESERLNETRQVRRQRQRLAQKGR